jgi:OmpA-OmpF porin, OOP family
MSILSTHTRIRRTVIRIAAVFAVVAFLAALSMMTGAQSNQFKVGVLPFVDNTGSNNAEVAGSVSRAVQAEMTHSTQLQGRVLTLAQDVDPNSVDADKAIAMARAQNVDVVIVGTILEANSESSNKGGNGPSIGGFSIGGNKQTQKATVTLQADLYNVQTGQKIDSIRQSGTATQSKVGTDVDTGIGGISTGGASFDNSAMGKAFHSAVTDLVKKINSEQGQMTHYAGSSSDATATAGGGATDGVGAGASSGVSASAGTNASASAPASVAGGQPAFTTVRIDFVPGERTIFLDDFSDMDPDAPPPHWKLRGNPVELHTGADFKELYAKDSVELTSGKITVPTNFTFELIWTGQGEMGFHFQDKDNNDQVYAKVRGEPDGVTADMNVDSTGGTLGQGQITVPTLDQPVNFSLWAQQGRVRAYLNGTRLLDVNQVEFGQIDHMFVTLGGFRPNGVRSIRIAESAPDFSTVINSSGKYVTHGIYFDTDSDHLKPESAPVLKMVAAALQKNPNLKLEIDGYTDSVGNATHNLDLSKRRAQAVQTVLVSQFSIDASRLTSNGMGAASPIGSNDTPDGRAANRRVEFLKK